MVVLNDKPILYIPCISLCTQLIGLGVFATGIYLLASQNNLDFLTGSEYASGGVLILIAGFITVAISLIGVFAAAGMWSVLFIIVSHMVVTWCSNMDNNC